MQEGFVFEASKAKQRSCTTRAALLLGVPEARLRALSQVRASASSASYVRAGQDALQTEGNDTTSDSKLQSSDSQDDPDDSEDDP